jgi:MiaB-like tRNA modifying enzyme
MTIKQPVVFIKTFGCSLNQSDSEVMSGLLEKSGFRVITEYLADTESNDSSDIENKIPKIDIVIINSCTVKNLAESKFYKELRKWNDRNVKVVIAGCIPQADPDLLITKLKNISVIGTRQISHVVDIVKNSLNDKIIQNITNDENERLNLPKIRKVGIIEILPISEGCTSNCTYCKTKHARGELLSYPKEKILEQFRSAIVQGCKEVWITSQDNGCYGFDIYRKEKYFLPQLLSDMLKVEGDFKIRLGMSNPDHVDRIKDELVEVFKHPKMFKFLHIPLQSGSNKVLREMKRPYTVEEAKNIIKLFRSKIPEITISTDLIIGFPNESDKEFEETLKLVEDVKFEVLNYSKFWPRKGTVAAAMKQLPTEMVKERVDKIKKLFESQSIERNKKYIGKTMKIMIDEYSKEGSIGRDEYYRQVVLDGREKLGSEFTVKIVDSTKYRLIGEKWLENR